MKMLVLLMTFISFQPAPIATPSNKFLWDQDAPALADAQTYSYKYYIDNASTGALFTNVVCSGLTAPFACSVQVPNMAQGTHTMTLTAGNAAGESIKSSPFVFAFVATPSTPGNIRIGG